MAKPAWYSVATEINRGNGWHPIHDPFYTAAEDPQQLIKDTIRDYDLDEYEQWIVRIYEGVRFDTVVAEARSDSQRCDYINEHGERCACEPHDDDDHLFVTT